MEKKIFVLHRSNTSNMRTSHNQYLKMVSFMEANGDLSKASNGPRDRYYIKRKWKELTKTLNSVPSGLPRSENKWRKVWSDYKNNCKRKIKKLIKINNNITGGSAVYPLSLTNLENRVMQIIASHPNTNVVVEAAQDGVPESPKVKRSESVEKEVPILDSYEIDFSSPGHSNQPTDGSKQSPSQNEDPLLEEFVPQLSPSSSDERPPSPKYFRTHEERQPLPKKRRKRELVNRFVELDRRASEYARERERSYEHLERERLRVRELEIREKVRQRDQELRMQDQWLQFMKEAMNVFVKYMERNDQK